MEYIKFNHNIQFEELLVIIANILKVSDDFETVSGSGEIYGVSDGRNVAKNTLCYLDKPPTDEGTEQLKTSFVITIKEVSHVIDALGVIVVDDPRALFIDIVNNILTTTGFSPFSSIVDAKAHIDPLADIHPNAIIERNVFIGVGSKISSGCVIKQGSYIGNNVTVRENTVIGCNGIALYKAMDNRIMRFPHIAGVIIQDGVEIGASCVLPRGVLTSSVIGENTVIGNLSNLGHATKVGCNVWMSVGCMIGGNTKIGDNSSIGLGVKVKDNLKIGNSCSIGMGAVVIKSIEDGVSVFGNPAKRIRSISAGPTR